MAIKPVPNLIQGVSQQAPQQRRDSQCEEQFDCINSAADGVDARPHTDFIKLYAGVDWEDAFFSETTHDDENYLTGISDGNMLIAVDLSDGTPCVITGSDTDGYTGTGAQSAFQKFRAQVVEDTTFIINRRVAPAMLGTLSPARAPEALVFVSAFQFDSKYEIVLSGPGAITASYTTDATNRSGGSEGIAFQLQALISGVAGYSCGRSGSTLHIFRADGADFTVATSDQNGDEVMTAFKSKVSAYSKLPAHAFDGVTLKVQGENRSKADDFYVRFTGASSTGTWEEVVAPSTPTTINPATMPHVLTCTGFRTFTYGPQNWSTRIAGDTTTAKDPSFVGKRLRDVFFDNRRLAILHEGGCVWSKIDFPFTFFVDTLQTLLATAPVDTKLVASNSSRGSGLLDFAVQVDDNLYLWAQRTQFRITSGQEVFKQDTIDSKTGTSYEYSETVDPLTIGSFLYFASEAGQFATVRSVQFNNGKALGDIDVTAHVPKYVPSNLRGMIASDTLRTVVAFSTSSEIFVYNFLTNDQEAVQSAWNTWRLPGGRILWASILSDQLRIMQQRPEGVAFLKLNLNSSAVDDTPGAEYVTRLDNRVDSEVTALSVSYNATLNTSSFTLPYSPTGAAVKVITKKDKVDGFTRGREFPVTGVVGAVVTVKGNLTGYAFYAGQQISAMRLESQFYDRSDKGVRPVDILQVNSFQLEFAQTGYTRLEVHTPNKPPRVKAYEGRRLGTSTAITETVKPDNDKLEISVGERAENAQIYMINDSYLPSRWQAASYDYVPIGRGGQT